MKISNELNELLRERERQNSQKYYYRRKKRRHSCLKFLGCLFAAIIVIIIIICLTIRLFIGPTIKKMDGLPGDFPQEFSFYQLDQAQISIQTPKAKQKIVELIKIMPDWLANPILNYFSSDLQNKLSQTFGDKAGIANNLTADDLKKAFQSLNPEQVKTVSLSWKELDKTKEGLAAYYQQKLKEANFEFKENIGDYEINLGFWKDGIFGEMIFSGGNGGDKSNAEIMVNYLKN